MIFINIIYDIQTKSLRLIGFSSNETYELNDIKFYITKDMAAAPYCRLIDSYNNENIIKLSKIKETDKNYDIFTVSIENIITNEAGLSSLSLFFFDEDVCLFSEKISIILDYDLFQSASQTYQLQQISELLSTKYAQIAEMTQMNINLYKDIEEAIQI